MVAFMSRYERRRGGVMVAHMAVLLQRTMAIHTSGTLTRRTGPPAVGRLRRGHRPSTSREVLAVPRGELRIYLGAAPGVGKTYAMLEEAQRRAERGTDVVIGFVETHRRQHTAALIGDLEVIARRTISYRRAEFSEMDLDAVLARRPEVAVVDELAHTNVSGCRHDKRWRDVQELLDAGITVLSTLNVEHLESLNDVVAQITGRTQRETVPDQVVRAAEQVELVDMTPEALRRRLAHGNIYRPDEIDATLSDFFRLGNLTALRELALLWLADKVDDQLDAYRAQHGISDVWEARERVVVALTGGREGETLIRRAARIAARSKGADLLALHVARNDGLAGADPARLARQRILVESLGGSYHQVLGTDIPAALLEFARGVNATQLVLGASRRGRFAHLFSRGVGVTTAALSGPIDVHLVTHADAGRGRRLTQVPAALSRRRRLLGYILAGLGMPLLTLALKALPQLTLINDILIFFAAVIGVALVGGLWPALLSAVGSSLLLNWFFTPPYHTLTIARSDNLLALFVFVGVAVAVSGVVDLAARRTREAARASADAQTLAIVAGSVLRGERPLPALLDQLRETFALRAVSVLELTAGAQRRPGRAGEDDAWRLVAGVGEEPAGSPHAGETVVPVDDRLAVVLSGRRLEAADRRIVEAFAAQAAVALKQQRLAEQAATLRPLAEADRMRTALLAAVSHDLRTPLASAKAAVSSLRSSEVEFDPDDRNELLATAEESLDRLTRLVANLLDMSRLQAGALGVQPTPIGLEDAVPRALDELGPQAAAVTTDIPADLPAVTADPGLLERVLVNIVGNALRHSPPEKPPAVTASAHADHVELRVIDTGAGIPADQWEHVFLPFQRLGDRDNTTGVGLGLALSRGLAEAMGGGITPETTPGGGLTMVLRLPAATDTTTSERPHR
jgi:two-component system sensor histidine kinase KdpD